MSWWVLSKMSDGTKEGLTGSSGSSTRLPGELLRSDEMLEEGIAVPALGGGQEAGGSLVRHLLPDVLLKRGHVGVRDVF